LHKVNKSLKSIYSRVTF